MKTDNLENRVEYCRTDTGLPAGGQNWLYFFLKKKENCLKFAEQMIILSLPNQLDT